MRLTAMHIAAALVLTAAQAAADTKPERGMASWYGSKLNGRIMASGAPMDRQRLTAAHRRLPLGTVIEVTNRLNGRRVIVTVTDRGPRRRDRIIDLSPAAAAVLHMRYRGLTPVEIRPAPFE